MSVTNMPNPPPPTGRPSGSAGRTTLMVMAFVLLARAMGMVRSTAIAHIFGQNQATDIYNRAFAVPDMMQLLLAGGALSTVFIPIFTDYLKENRDKEAWKAFGQILSLVALFGAIFVFIFEVSADVLTPLLAPKFPIQKLPEMTHISRILIPAQWFFFTGGILIAALQAKNRFQITSLSPIIYNLGIIIGALSQLAVPPEQRSTIAMAWGAVIGAGLGQFLVPLVEIIRMGARWPIGFQWKSPVVKEFITLLLPALLGLGLPQLQYLMMGLFLDSEGGEITALKNANELTQAPIGIFAQASAIVLFPLLARLAEQKDWKSYRKEVHFGVRKILFLTVPTSLTLAVLAEVIVRILFESKKTFGPHEIEIATQALRIYALSTFAVSAQAILGRGFFAMKDTKTPLSLTKWMLLLTLSLYTISTSILGKITVLGHSFGLNLSPSNVYLGLSITTVLVLTLNMLLFLTRLSSRVGGLNIRGLARATAKITLAAVIAAGVTYIAIYPLHHLIERGRPGAIFSLLLSSSAGICAYIAASYFFGVAEIKSVGAMLQRQAKK
jgi:putative peptidoglycan lipid II flippase